MKHKWIGFICLSFLLAGCVEQKIIDDINIMSAVGYDAEDEGKVKGTIVIPVYKADKSISNEQFIAVGKQSKEVNRLSQMKSADPLENGAIEVVVFSKEMAERGVYEITDTFERDARIGTNILMAVVDGEASKLLSKNLGNLGTGAYLNTLLQHNMKVRELPIMNLHLFLYSYYSPLKDPFLPFIKLAGNKVKITGVALFDKDVAVSYLNEEELFFFKAIMENFRNGSHTFKVGKDEVTTYSITMKREYKVKDALTQPKVHLHIELEAHIREYSGKKLDPKIVDKIGKTFEQVISKRTTKLLEDFRDQHIDPVGIGILAKTQTKHFDEKKWNDSYGQATFRVTTKAIIAETGVIE